MLEVEPTGKRGRTATSSGQNGGGDVIFLPSGRYLVSGSSLVSVSKVT